MLELNYNYAPVNCCIETSDGLAKLFGKLFKGKKDKIYLVKFSFHFPNLKSDAH